MSGASISIGDEEYVTTELPVANLNAAIDDANAGYWVSRSNDSITINLAGGIVIHLYRDV